MVTCYDIATNKMAVTLQKGWFGAEVKDFLLEQPEVKEVSWDTEKYRPKSSAGSGKAKKAAKRRKKSLSSSAKPAKEGL